MLVTQYCIDQFTCILSVKYGSHCCVKDFKSKNNSREYTWVFKLLASNVSEFSDP